MEFREFLLRQPGYPEEMPQDRYYFRLAEKLERRVAETCGAYIGEALGKRVALTLADYMQDIVADGGLWRGFVEANRKLYGWSVPFHPCPEEYVDYELNREDVRFLVWYAVAMLDEHLRDIYPHDGRILKIADACHELLEEHYDEAPIPEGWHLVRGLEMFDEQDRPQIIRLTEWLFSQSYLLTPAFALTMHEILSEVVGEGDEAVMKAGKLLDEAVTGYPTGPLALYAFEWTSLLIEGKLPAEAREEAGKEHPYYSSFVNDSCGCEIKYFRSYEDMNSFFISALGWEEGKEHLDMAKGADDYVLLVNRGKGMLMARNVARCIADPDNPLYDAEYAREHGIELLTVRGLCPADLLHYVIGKGWFPETHFPGSEDCRLVEENRDFIARCFLQNYYRGD